MIDQPRAKDIPTPIILKDDITVELVLLHRYGSIKTFPLPKYESPIFARRKLNGRLSLNGTPQNQQSHHTRLREQQPSSQQIVGCTKHMAEKKLFCKLDCSQDYHCLQMAGYQSIQFRQQNICIQTPCPRTQPFIVCFLIIYEIIPRLANYSREVFTIC